jgi:acetoin utilization deacetylase AcuC-like enzyme
VDHPLASAGPYPSRMRVWTHADHPFPLPEGHRYPLAKYALLRDRLRAEGTVTAADTPAPISWEALARVHDAAFLERMRTGALDRREGKILGLPWSEPLVERARRGTRGTLRAARDALDGQAVGVMLGGGTHHAGHASARGYCLVNDIAVTTTELRREGRLRRVLVVDCDVHRGDGTAELLTPDPEAYTLSLHCDRNWVAGGPTPRVPSDLDVDLPAGTGDDLYLSALAQALAVAVPGARPELVLYLAGADPWEGDALGKLAVTKAGLRTRDELVLDVALRAGVPVVVTLAGGYPPDVEDGVDIHAGTVAAAAARAR